MAALMSTTSAFAGVKVQARVNVRSTRAQTVIMANGAGPKRVRVFLMQFLTMETRRCTRMYTLWANHTTVITHGYRSSGL